MYKVIEVSKDMKQFRVIKQFGDETTGVLFKINFEKKYPILKGRVRIVRASELWKNETIFEIVVGEEIIRVGLAGFKPPTQAKAELMAKEMAKAKKAQDAYQRLLAQQGPKVKKQK